jgi:hypothetical protein
MPHLTGPRSLADRFGGSVVGLCGVVHDGVAPYPDGQRRPARLRNRSKAR